MAHLDANLLHCIEVQQPLVNPWQAKVPLPMQIAKPRILIVDDEPNVRLTLQAILEQEGYDVQTAENGEVAFRAVRAQAFDLVLTDLKMPGIDGMGVLAEVKKRSPNTVTIMMTGYGSLDSAIEAVRLGAYEYLLKPADPEHMKLAVRRSLERRRLSEIDTLYSLSRALTRASGVEAISEEVCNATVSVLGLADASLVVFSHDDVASERKSATAKMLFSPEVFERLSAGAIVGSHECADVRHWTQRAGIASAALVPGVAGERLVCVLIVHNGAEAFDFHASAQRFLINVAGQAALTIENALLLRDLRSNNEELSEANRKLRELDTLKSQFLSVATHELRTPLSVILGYNAMLAESLADRLSPEEQEVLAESVTACKRLIRLVNSMLDITQIESGKMQMSFAPADLREIANGVVRLFAVEAQRKRIQVVVNAPAELPRTSVDSERIEQVLVNLIGNALKFTPEGGRVTLTLRYRPDRRTVDISVSDTGVGIAPADQGHIFDEFAQIRRQSANRHREGSGLGLAIARRIVEAHGGMLGVESSPGRGSTFTATIPARERQPEIRTAVSA